MSMINVMIEAFAGVFNPNQKNEKFEVRSKTKEIEVGPTSGPTREQYKTR